MDSDVKERPSAVQRFLRNPAAPRHEPEVKEAQESFHGGRARSRETVMLDACLADGTIESFNYAYLTRVKYKPGDRLILRFGQAEIAIEGRNLLGLRHAITEHRQRFIKLGTEAEESSKPEDAEYIERIVITEGEDEI